MTTMVIEDGRIREYDHDGNEVVNWDDPRWRAAGISYRMVDYWTSQGHLNTVGDINPGIRQARRWPVAEIGVAGRILRLRSAGIRLDRAAAVARASGPVELAPGVWVVCGAVEEMAPTCEVCHQHPSAEVRHGNVSVCTDCAKHADYYANLTPEELRAEQDAMAAYCDETSGWAS